ncbi:hypothetical protein KY290_008276 [Solanum tuberosum]|uniref:C2 domain-containing protein n=2 Tax=Solanum tuberosum TaxID=4113 RepID=A0ABQ7WA23_SOLTU|nr:PREDICTED: uncharacterized protein LOC102590556 [Solanum tuberosum]KAH0746553.1 hypothetical protein KY285_008210 [Solanum tuberosum]KAH0776865.1 hypothetical protein KY290_008276 [Solanum tuberosum]
MDSFKQTSTGFLYNSNLSTDSESELSGVLEIHVHHARNIHNICIYNNQDVYAKFSLTYNPDEAISTRIINGGGKNPDFNEDLAMKVSQVDSILKCEIWMLSRAKALMEDQLLGFALVPISSVVGKGKITQDFSLSSTDLFHSPAGIVKLSLFLNTNNLISVSNNPSCSPSSSSSISSEVVLLDRNTSQVILDPVEYSRIEFPEISLVQENQEMVSQYFDLGGSFLQLSAFHSHYHDDQQQQPQDDYEMAAINPSEDDESNISPKQNSWFLSSSMTSSLSDDRNSADSSPDKQINDNKKDSIKKEDEELKEPHVVFTAPLGNIIKIDAEQSGMQQQIVDMYMRSMQQFTESLAKMKLPLDLDKADQKDHGSSSSDMNNNRKENSRVFYGSRAFF